MRFCDVVIKGVFEEGFNFEFNLWGDCGKKSQSKIEDYTCANSFKFGIRVSSDNVILKFSL